MSDGVEPASGVIPAEVGIATPDGGLELEHEGEIRRCRIGFESVGDPDRPTVVVLGGISADRHATSHEADDRPGWWEDFVGEGRPLDTRRFRALGIDWIGGPGESSAPVRRPDPSGIPAVTTGDQATAVAAVMDELGIERLRGFVGASYGAMVALAFGERYPDRVERLVCISGAHESHPMATALRALQRWIALFGIESGREGEGLVMARALAMTTYRSDREFRERFGNRPRREEEAYRFPVEDYLEYQGRKFADRFSVDHFLYLCQSLDLHSVRPEAVEPPVTLVGVEEDRLVPMWQMEELRDRLAGEAELIRFSSLYGHDAFLKEEERMREALATLASPGARSR